MFFLGIKKGDKLYPVHDGRFKPDPATPSMTQNCGVTENGKIKTTPTTPTAQQFIAYVLKSDDNYALFETTIAELNAAIASASTFVAVRLIDDVAYMDDYTEYTYSGYPSDYTIHNFSSVTVDSISVMQIDRANGNVAVSVRYKPSAKTMAMTQAVGVDDDGELWTVPGGGGGGSFDIHSLETEDDVSPFDEMPFYDVSVGATVKTTWLTLRAKVRAFLDGYFVKSVNGKKDVVKLTAADIDTDFIGREPQFNFRIEGEFDMGLISVLDAAGQEVTATEIIAALNSGLGVGFSVYDQTHSIEYTTAAEFKYLITGTNVNIAFSVARGHYYTPAVVIVSWSGSFWDEEELDADTGGTRTKLYVEVPDARHVWNTQEMLVGLDNRITDVKDELEALKARVAALEA